MLKRGGAVRRCYGPCDTSCLGIDGFFGPPAWQPIPLLCRFYHPLRKFDPHARSPEYRLDWREKARLRSAMDWRKRKRPWVAGGGEDVLRSGKRVAGGGEDVPGDGRLELPYSGSSGERAFRVYSEWKWARNRPAREFAAAFTIQRYVRAFFLRKHVANVQRDDDCHPGQEPDYGCPTADVREYWEALKGDFVEQMGHSRTGSIQWEHEAGSRMYNWVDLPAPWRSKGRRECTAPGWCTLLRYGYGPGSVVVRREPLTGAAAAENLRWMEERLHYAQTAYNECNQCNWDWD